MPHGDAPNTYGGVFTRPAAVVVATLVALAAVAGTGWKARDAIDRAEAAQLDGGEVRALREEMRDLSRKIEELNTRLSRLEGRADVRTSGIGR